MRQLVALGAAAIVAALAPILPAGADPVRSCTPSAGTVIAVDYHHWGGPIVQACDLAHPKRGIDLLTDEGFRTTGTQHDGPLFVCRIGNEAWSGGTQYPTPAQDPCVATPPASAYWSYWLAPPGRNTWSYSRLGAFSDTPQTGEVQLWIFGSTHIQGSAGDPTDGFPTCSPNALRAGTATSCTPSAATHPTTSAPRPRPSHSVAASSSHPVRATEGPRSRTTSARTSAPSTTAASSSPGRVVAGSPVSGGRTVDIPFPGNSVSAARAAVEAKPAAKSTPTGSVLPVVLGVGLAAVFALGGGWTVWRRRRAQ